MAGACYDFKNNANCLVSILRIHGVGFHCQARLSKHRKQGPSITPQQFQFTIKILTWLSFIC